MMVTMTAVYGMSVLISSRVTIVYTVFLLHENVVYIMLFIDCEDAGWVYDFFDERD